MTVAVTHCDFTCSLTTWETFCISNESGNMKDWNVKIAWESIFERDFIDY